MSVSSGSVVFSVVFHSTPISRSLSCADPELNLQVCVCPCPVVFITLRGNKNTVELSPGNSLEMG